MKCEGENEQMSKEENCPQPKYWEKKLHANIELNQIKKIQGDLMQKKKGPIKEMVDFYKKKVKENKENTEVTEHWYSKWGSKAKCKPEENNDECDEWMAPEDDRICRVGVE